MIFVRLNFYNRSLIVIFTCASVLLASARALANEYQHAVEAYQAGEFHKASRIFKKYAAKGQPDAQRYLGEMYDKGRGVRQDYSKAVYWYLRAAAQNDAGSQYLLGIKYANGHGVKVDNKQAYAWFALAFDNGFAPAANPLLVLNKTMSAEERQHALQTALDQIKHLQ